MKYDALENMDGYYIDHEKAYYDMCRVLECEIGDFQGIGCYKVIKGRLVKFSK